MESVNKRVIIISLILALFTTVLVYLYIKGATTKPEVVEYINVYVAAKTMSAKYEVKDDDVKQVRVTRDYLNPNAVLNKADIVGKRLADRIIAGEQILKERLVEDNNLNLSYNIKEGMRAVSVNVNEQVEVANLLEPGDYVDIIASFPFEKQDIGPNSIIEAAKSQIVIQNLKVLALGQYTGKEEEKKGNTEAQLPKTVTLEASPKDSEKLVFVSEFASIRMALRRVDDDKIIPTEGTLKDDVLSDRGVIVVPKQ
ncbi:MAG: Flp pilus assembly protein CpaB [Clostridiaceae bacterium]|nr:Flp pilus assembly protein CpaB [Clostridiaceae bacterium]